MYKADPIKQIGIQAQHATGQAIQLIIHNKSDLKDLKTIADRIMQVELELAGKHVEIYKQISDKSRSSDIEKILELLKKAKTKDKVHDLWKSLTEDEQVQHNKVFTNKLSKLK